MQKLKNFSKIVSNKNVYEDDLLSLNDYKDKNCDIKVHDYLMKCCLQSPLDKK